MQINLNKVIQNPPQQKNTKLAKPANAVRNVVITTCNYESDEDIRKPTVGNGWMNSWEHKVVEETNPNVSKIETQSKVSPSQPLPDPDDYQDKVNPKTQDFQNQGSKQDYYYTPKQKPYVNAKKYGANDLNDYYEPRNRQQKSNRQKRNDVQVRYVVKQ